MEITHCVPHHFFGNTYSTASLDLNLAYWIWPLPLKTRPRSQILSWKNHIANTEKVFIMVLTSIILVQIQVYYSTGTNDKVKTLCRLFKSFSKKRVADPELSVLNPDMGSYLSSHWFSSGKYATLGWRKFLCQYTVYYMLSTPPKGKVKQTGTFSNTYT